MVDGRQRRLIWQCQHCDDVVVSYSHLRHDINYCECKKTAVDFEEYYSRIIGDKEPVTISLKEYKKGKWCKK